MGREMGRNQVKGAFITLEGSEGGGKSTQATMLYNYLIERGYPVLATREPGGTPLGEKIRELLLDKNNTSVDPLAECFLFAASRRQHISEKIAPALNDGVTVICDRFFDATTAYQGYGRHVNVGDLRKINDITCWGVYPDLTILLDLDPELGLARARERNQSCGQACDRFEILNLDFFKRIRAGYLALAGEEPERFCVIDANASVQAIHEQIVECVSALMQKRYSQASRSFLGLQRQLLQNDSQDPDEKN